MNAPRAPASRYSLMRRHLTHAGAGLGIAMLLGACANGDFGRVRPSLVSDDIHAWVGRQAARDAGRTASTFPLTDDERQLRDLAFPLIEPPYDRGRWDSVLLEWGITRTREVEWPAYDRTTYGKHLLARAYRSPAARYAQLTDDIRNDVVRIAPFVSTAQRVLDMDAKRDKSMSYVSGISAGEIANAKRRIAENALVVDWVRHSLRDRVAAYQYALERCVIETPFPSAAEADAVLNQLRQQIAAARLAFVMPPRSIAVAAG